MSNLPKEFLSVQGLGTQGLHKQLRSLLRNKVSNRKLISYIFFSLLHYVQSCLYSLADVFLKRDLPTSYFAVLSTKAIEIVSREGVTRLLFKHRYRKIASSNTSCLEAHVGFFRLLMKGIFGPYVL